MEDDLKSEVGQEPEAPDNSATIADILRAAAVDSDDYEEPEETPAEEPEETPQEESPKDNPPQEAPKDAPYTLEELIEMGKSETFDKLNTARIPPELQPVYKSLNAMATRRQQSLAEKEKELDARLAQLAGTNAKASPAPAVPLEQRVYADPVGVMQELQSRIAETNSKLLKAQETEDIFEVQKLLVQKDELKDKFRAVQGVVEAANREWEGVYKSIPDFQQKAPKLVEFANSVLGDKSFTGAELNWITNPMITGKISTKLVHLINEMYEMKVKHEEASKAVEEKLKKVKPSPAVAPGSGEVVSRKDSVKALREKALVSNDDIDLAEYIATITSKGK